MKANKLFILVLLFTFLQQGVFAQNLTGNWQGIFNTDMDFRGSRRSFFLNMTLIQQGKKIEGNFSNAPLDFPSLPQVAYTISGKLKKKEIIPNNLMLNRIIKNNLRQGVAEVFWQFDDIRYYKNDTIEVLYGKWLPNGSRTPRSDGAGGTFWVRKMPTTDTVLKISESENSFATYLQRKNNSTIDSFTCNTTTINIELYDNGTIDGDSVSVYLNDNVVLQNKLLTAIPTKIQLQLEKNKTYTLSLFAENLGKIPPNTALLKIDAGEFKKEIFLSSTYQKNATIILKIKE
jgi:hypothetical protein